MSTPKETCSPLLFLAGAAGLPAWINCPCHPQPSHDCLGCLVLSLSHGPSWATMGLSKSIQISPRHSLGGETSPLSSRRVAPLLFLTEPSPPATAGPASRMPAKMQIPRGSRGGSKAWLWHGKSGSPPRQGGKGRLLHPPPQHDVGMVTPCPSCSITGGHSQCKPTPACLAWVKRQRGQDPLPPQIPNLAPRHPSCPSLLRMPTSTGRGFCREAVVPACPSQWPSPSRPPPPPQLLLARVSSPVFGSGASWTLLKSFLCARAHVCVSVLIT